MKRFLSTVLVLALSLALSACSSSGPSPTSVAKGYMEAMKSGDLDKSSTYLVNGYVDEVADLQDDPDTMELLKVFFSRMTVEYGKETISGDTAAVAVTVTVPDMAEIMVDAMGELLKLALENLDKSDEEGEKMAQEMVLKMIGAEDAPMTTTEGVMELTKVGKEWKISAIDVDLGLPE